MSARKSLPIGIIVMILMMVLSALGVGYAWWTEQLSASGSIQTGTIDIKLERLEAAENDELNAGRCSYKLSGDNKVVTVTLENVYPNYVCTIHYRLNNFGTIPAKITNINLPILTGEFVVIPRLDETMLLSSEPVEGEFYIEIRDKALEAATYKFDLSFDVIQANAP
jgi:predicted ribosomally synthesized peptide with SipW-like signal peptide